MKSTIVLIFLSFSLFLCSLTVMAKPLKHTEKYYQEIWCNAYDGKMEVVMENGSRCDCLTEDNAAEFDFAHKWAESVGQSLNYSQQTGKRAGIVLIAEKMGDMQYVEIVQELVEKFNLPIDIFIMWGVTE